MRLSRALSKLWHIFGFERFMLKSENDIVPRKLGVLREYERGLRARLKHGLLSTEHRVQFYNPGPWPLSLMNDKVL